MTELNPIPSGVFHSAPSTSKARISEETEPQEAEESQLTGDHRESVHVAEDSQDVRSIEFPDIEYGDDNGDRVEALLAWLRSAKAQLASGELKAEEREALQNQFMQMVEHLEAEGAFQTIQHEGLDLFDSGTYLLRAVEVMRDIDSRNFEDHMTVFSLLDMAESLYYSHKGQSTETANERVNDMFNDIQRATTERWRIRRPATRRDIERTVIHYAREANYQFNPTLEGGDRFNPFADPHDEAEDIRDHLREHGPDRKFRSEFEGPIQDLLNQNEDSFEDSAITSDSLVEMFFLLNKQGYSEDMLDFMFEELVFLAQQEDEEQMALALQSLAEQADFEFYPGLQSRDRFNPFLDHEDAYEDIQDEVSLARQVFTRFRVGISIGSNGPGIDFAFRHHRGEIEIPQWLGMMFAHGLEESPEKLRSMLHTFSPIILEYNEDLNYDREHQRFYIEED